MGQAMNLWGTRLASLPSSSVLRRGGGRRPRTRSIPTLNVCTDAQHPKVEVEDVCAFVQGLSLDFGYHASVYARAMKVQEIDGEALLHLNADHLKELGVSSEHRSLLLARIRDLPLTRSTAS